ncbi:MAG: hypothetical protein RL422_1387, partial [Bacteroidota bacterium]
MKLTRWVLGWCLVLGSLTAFSQDEANKNVLDRIIVKVDNYFILKSEVENQYQQYITSGQANTPNRCQILEGLVVNKLMLAKAEIDSVIVDDKRIEAELNSRMEQMEGQYGSAKNIVEAYGKSIATLKEDLRSSLKEQLTG